MPTSSRRSRRSTNTTPSAPTRSATRSTTPGATMRRRSWTTRSKTTAAPSRCARRTPARKCSAIPACRWHIRCSTAASASLTITAGLPRTAERRGILRQRSRRRRISITKCTMPTTAMWRSTGALRASAARTCSPRCRTLSCANGRRWTMTGAAACRACPA